MRTYRPDTAARARSAGVALSMVLVGVPSSGLVAAAALVRHLLASEGVATDPAVALLALAATSLAAVLGWATAAAAAGVRQGWQHAVGDRGRTTTSRVPPHRRGDLVAAAVAALVVATLTAPTASAGTQAAPTATATATATVQDRQQAQDQPAADRDAAERPTGLPGSWSALADGFRAPAGASPGATGLVTGHPSRPVDAPREVVVVAGDSLWAIAARHLGPGADDAQVAQAWPAWWQTNRSTIGEDPDLLLPGQRLTVPAG